MESPFKKLDLPFTLESLKTVLTAGAGTGTPLTHQQIADWCFRFWLSSIKDAELDAAAEIAFDVNVQWELYLANAYTLGELQTMDFSKVRLPEEWFDNWQRQLADRDI